MEGEDEEEGELSSLRGEGGGRKASRVEVCGREEDGGVWEERTKEAEGSSSVRWRGRE